LFISGELSELAATLLQVTKVTLFSYLSMFQNEYFAASLDCTHSVSNDDNSSILHGILNGTLNLLLISFIKS
jgi:hypothetical protein